MTRPLPKTLQIYVDYMAKENRPVTFLEIVNQTPRQNTFAWLQIRRLIVEQPNYYKPGEPYTGPRYSTYTLTKRGLSYVTAKKSEPAAAAPATVSGPVPELENIDFTCMTWAQAKATLAKLSDPESLDKMLGWLKWTNNTYCMLHDAISHSDIPMACRERAMIVLLMQQNERYRADAMKRFTEHSNITYILKKADAEQSPGDRSF